jgi:hypothetical protein
MKLRSAIVLGFGTAAALAFGSMSYANDQVFTGYARDIKSRELLYVEAHAVRGFGTAREERVVKYLCTAGGAAFARKELDYGVSRTEPSFKLEDARTGYSEGLRRNGASLEVFQRASSKAEVRKKAVPNSVAIVSDAGFDEFVRKNWSALESGNAVRFPFLVPSRLDSMTFKVKKHGDGVIEGQPVSVIRLNLSGFLGWFLPYIEVSYRKSDRVLMRYKGLTNIRDAEGNNVTAQIDFPSKERVAKPVDLDALRAAPLVTKC